MRLAGKYNDAKTAYFEIAHKVLFAADGNVGWLAHVVAAIKPANKIASLRDTEHCR